MSPLVPLNTNIYLQEAKGLALALHIKGVQFEDATRDRRLRPFLSFPRLRFMQSRNSLPSLSPSRAGMHALRSRNGSLDPPPLDSTPPLQPPPKRLPGADGGPRRVTRGLASCFEACARAMRRHYVP